jgi:beta-glucosidase
MLHPAIGSDGEGLKAEYFAGGTLAGQPVLTRLDHAIDFDWNSAAPVSGVTQDHFAVRWTGTITPPQPGTYNFTMRLAHCSLCGDSERFNVLVDGKAVGDGATEGAPSRRSGTPHFTIDFADTDAHALTVEYLHNAPLFGGGISLEWVPPPGVLQKQAVAVAAESDLVLAMVGLSPELEGEEMPIKVEGFAGGDRTDIELPAPQRQMLEQVAATGKPMIVVLLNGSALAVNWADEHANAILEAWYPGEFGGKALADTLTGTNNPSGRLPITFYKSLEELPAFSDYAMNNRTYRYFTGPALYKFGYGLSYTSFAYSHLKLSTAALRAGDSLTAEVDVTNTGTLAGDEVAELYLLPPATGNEGLSPKLQLDGFERIHLAAGESRHLTFQLGPRQLSEVDRQGARAVQPGDYRLSVGGAQPGDSKAATHPQTAGFTIEGSFALPH